MKAYLRPGAAVLALVLNLAGITVWIFRPPWGVAEMTAQQIHDEARRNEKAAKYVEARHRFRFCAERFPDTVFGERSAYFSALTAMQSIGDLPAARDGFRAYVARYPKGVFVRSAQENLSFLEKVPAEPADAGIRYLRVENLIAAERFREAEVLLLDLRRRVPAGAFSDLVGARTEWVRSAIVSGNE